MTGVAREDVSYLSDGDEIAAWFYPAGGDGPAPAIVFCPGFTGTRQAAFYQPYIERFVAAGYGVLLADYRGWGDSAGPKGEIVPLRQVADVRNGLGYLETRAGARLVFSMIANNYTAPNAAIDAIMERALTRIAERFP